MSESTSGTAQRVLLTGGAGFIGSHLCERLLAEGHTVWVLDNFNDYYDPRLKRATAARFEGRPRYRLVEGDIRDRSLVDRLFGELRFEVVVHLAAMPGVRESVRRPDLYFDVNVNGTVSLLEAARHAPGVRFVFGSSSSVYGRCERLPFRESEADLLPVSPYAASKRAGELVCYTYHNLYAMPITCLRFFTVYGPRQRPEMAIRNFTRRIHSGEELPLFGDGSARRDFTHVSDIVEGTVRAIDRCEGFHIYNLGESRTVTMRELIALIGRCLGAEPRIRVFPGEAGDVPATWADISLAEREIGYRPSVPLEDGIRDFVRWYLDEGVNEEGASPSGARRGAGDA
jgi:UDP-glucuronate 4-epimerase